MTLLERLKESRENKTKAERELEKSVYCKN